MITRVASSDRTRELILGLPIDAVSWPDATDRILEWADRGECRAVCVVNVHSLMTARRSAAHAEAIRSADLVTPDGAPVAWMLRRKGHVGQSRISGPDLMWQCCRAAAERRLKMFLFGATPGTLGRLRQNLSAAFPGIRIVGALSPPFRALSAEEDAAVIATINGSGAQIVWLGLGCPKQEAWLHAHRGRIGAVMVGVGAAFDFHAGLVKRAPLWLRRCGLEWLYRLWQEPRRLASRYLVMNTRFILAALRELLNRRPAWDGDRQGRGAPHRALRR